MEVIRLFVLRRRHRAAGIEIHALRVEHHIARRQKAAANRALTGPAAARSNVANMESRFHSLVRSRA
ncbi:hypothetical protein ETX26_14010 [Pelagerythrobacter rhizovicinus]|uniref:Uncharacterized protein n=1 Tax=Pelagerythrobacter rhizovicinus TaxID=2268576 RepID=A0A4Q2KNB4_9SPHN|nr:hypothetical protein ETX26_14010 [Pelagerythrobacter rhizovicinus]